jgi:adenylosuccinate synthase
VLIESPVIAVTPREEHDMPVTAIVGAQWGDEGKGKITDLLAQTARLIIRFGGGSNAGHTVINDQGEFRLHVIPSGIFNPNAAVLVGTGTAIDFDALGVELGFLVDRGVETAGLHVSSRAQVVMPYHLDLDRLQDEARGERTLGTTRRGIGPAYTDKAARVGIQAGDLQYPDVVRAKLELLLPDKNRALQALGAPPISEDEIYERVDDWSRRFGGLVVDQVPLVDEALQRGVEILLEGQLGAMRDLDWGTYPYVTSSTTLAGGGAVGGGIPPTQIRRVVGVVKAYTSAVGTGPLPTELFGEEGDDLRERGREYGATTGRPRRVGWFDAVASRYGRMLNGFTELAVTKLDVLDGLESVKACTGYRVGDVVLNTVPITPSLEEVVPVYESLSGWEGPISPAQRWEDLPGAARSYIEFIEETVGARVSIISVGPARNDTITRG